MVSLQKFGRVYVLTLLGDGDEHRFTEASCKAIIQALETVQNSSDAGALVTTNEGKFFSNGLNLAWVETLQTETPYYNFRRMIAMIVNINVPTIAAICGHAAAGGFVFALAHDHRCMRRDRGYLYMSEMDVKVRLPISQMTVLRTTLSPKAFKDTMLLARKQTADEALKSGIVDSVHGNSTQTLEAAIAWAQELCSRGWDRNFYRNMRLDMHPGLSEVVDYDDHAPLYKQHASKL